MIFFSDDNSEMGFFNNQDLNSDINSENNNLLEDQYMKENWDNNEEKILFQTKKIIQIVIKMI